MGMPTANTGMFELTDFKVPAGNLLGPEGDGFRIAMGTLVSGRLSVASGCLGVIEDCLIEALRYAKERQQHGKAIGKHQLVQEHLAAIEMDRLATEALVMQGRPGQGGQQRQPEQRRTQGQCRPAGRPGQAVRRQGRLGRRRPGRAGFRRPRLVHAVPARPASAGRARLPDLRGHR